MNARAHLKNIIRGMGSVLDIYPAIGVRQFRVRVYTHNRSDAEALHQDWKKIGEDIRCSIEKYANGEKVKHTREEKPKYSAK